MFKHFWSTVFLLWLVSAPVAQADTSPQSLTAEMDAQGKTVQQMVVGLEDAGVASTPDIAAAIWSAGRTDTASIAQALRGHQRDAGETAIALARIPDGPDREQIVHGLRGAGYSAGDIALAMREITVGEGTGVRGAERDLIVSLHRAETLPAEIGEGLREVGEVSVPRLTEILRQAGLPEREIGELLNSAGARDNEALLFQSLEQAGYSAEEMALVLYHAGYEDTRRMTSAAFDAGMSPIFVSDMIFSLEDRVSRQDFFFRLYRQGVPLATVSEILERHGLSDVREIDQMLADTRYDTNEHVQIWRYAGFSSLEAAEALATLREVGAVRAANTLERAGYTDSEIAEGLAGKFWSPEDTFDALRRVPHSDERTAVAESLFAVSFTTDESIEALQSHRNYRTPDLVAAGMIDGAEISLQETAQKLIWEGYTAAEIRDALAETTDKSEGELRELLDSAPVQQTAVEWGLEETERLKAEGASGRDIAEHLRASGHLPPEHIARNLEQNGWHEPTLLVRIMTEAGFPPEEVIAGIEQIEGITKANVVAVLHHLGLPSEKVAEALQSVGVRDVVELWYILEEAGLPMEAIGKGLATVTGGGLAIVLEGLKTVGIEPEELGHVLKGFAAGGTHSARQISQGLQEMDVSPAGIVTVLETMDRYSVQTVVDVLKESGLPANDVAVALLETGYRTRTEVVQAFRNANYSPVDVIEGLQEFGLEDGADFVRELTGGGFSPEEIMEALMDTGYGTAEDLAEIFREGIGLESSRLASMLNDRGFDIRETAHALHHLGTSPMRIGSSLYDAGWRNFRDIVDALRQIGFTGRDTLRTVLEFLGADDLEISSIFD